MMSANIRATPPPPSSGRQGRRRNVLGSGIAIMSDSSIALKPVIEEPSKPMPASKAPSRSWELIENDFSWPRMSVNHRRMKRTPLSRTWARTSSVVVGCSSGAMRAQPRGRALSPSDPVELAQQERTQRRGERGGQVGRVLAHEDPAHDGRAVAPTAEEVRHVEEPDARRRVARGRDHEWVAVERAPPRERAGERGRPAPIERALDAGVATAAHLGRV